MKYLLNLFLFFFLLFPTQAHTLLSDSDPQNFFVLLDRVQSGEALVILGKVEKTQNPATNKRYFLHTVQILNDLGRNLSTRKILVMEDQWDPTVRSALSDKNDFVLFLSKSKVPPFDSFRILGGSSRVIPVYPQQRDRLLAIIKHCCAFSPNEKKGALIQALQFPDKRIAQDAAIYLGEMKGIALSSKEISTLLQVLQQLEGNTLAQLGLVKGLKNSGDPASREALRSLAKSKPSSSKWRAIQALEELGEKIPTTQLVREVEFANPDQQPAGLNLIVKRQDAAAVAFLRKLLASGGNFEIQRLAIEKMGDVGGTPYEQLLVENLKNPQEPIVVQSLIALGKMQSVKMILPAIHLLDHGTPHLRGAAFLALSTSQDPEAVHALEERYERGPQGIWKKREHFHEH